MYQHSMMKCVCYALFFIGFQANAAWIGPTEVLSGGWGSGSNQFGFEHGDTDDTYAMLYDISGDGKIVISDQINSRAKVYDSNGVLLSNITPPVSNPAEWGYEPSFAGENIVISLDKIYFISVDGKVVSANEDPDVITEVDFMGGRGDKYYISETKPKKQWFVYAPDGKLLNTIQEKPLELGRVEEKIFLYQGEKWHRITISYPDKKWVTVNTIGSCAEYNYSRDSASNVYCGGGQSMARYSMCGKAIANFVLPETRDEALVLPSPEEGVEAVTQVIEGFYDLQLANNGDLYASKITPEKYSVVKWAWQDSPDDPIGGPDAPVELSALAADGVMLSWTFSLQDPGCVTQYEIGRSTTAGGPYAKVADVPATGKTKESYTYTDATVESAVFVNIVVA